MRRKEKLQNIKKLNEALNNKNKTINEGGDYDEFKAFSGEKEGEMTETSPEKALGAANKLYQNKIGGDEHDNERAKKLLKTYGEKLKGAPLFNGQVDYVEVKLIRNQKDSKNEHAVSQLVIFIHTNFNVGIFYNYSIDQFMDGATFETAEPLSRPITKAHARELFKIAAHFNPKTRYANYTRELNIKVDEGASMNESTNSMFEKLCGVKIIKEDVNTNLELKSVAKQIFSILKKYQLAPQYNTGEINQFTSQAPAKGYGAIVTVNDNGILGVGVYDRGLWGTLKENALQELDMGTHSNPSPEEQQQIDQKANMIYKDITATLGQDKFEIKSESGTNEYGYYIIHIRLKP